MGGESSCWRKNMMQLAHAVEGPQGNMCVNLFAQLASAPENFVVSLYLEEHDFTSDGSVDLASQYLGLGDSWELSSLEQEQTDCQVFPSLPVLPSSCCTLFLNIRRWMGDDLHALGRTHPLNQIYKPLVMILSRLWLIPRALQSTKLKSLRDSFSFFQARWSRKGLIPEMLIKWVRKEMIHRQLYGGSFMNVSYWKACEDIWVQEITGTLNSVSKESFLPC